MRIIAGHLKGRRLVPPSWSGVRPTSDKLRETLFNVLASRVVGARVLDGYAGTGAIGIEALSRGAAHVTFIERDRRAAALIARNLAGCAVVEGYTIVCADLARGVAGPESAYDLVLLDPPYDCSDMTGVLDALAPRLTTGGLLVLERAARTEPPMPTTLERTRDLTSGDSALSFFVRR